MNILQFAQTISYMIIFIQTGSIRRLMCMNMIHLLNIFYREDVITDLLANLINHEETFAKWFAKTVCEIPDEDYIFKAKTRVSLGKGIGTPDLVLERKKDGVTNLLIVIENKLGALEGIEQTNRYASDEGKEKLFSLFQVEKNVPIKFLFLTLDPFTPAKNRSFKKKDYRDFCFIDWNDIIYDSASRKIMVDYSSLLEEFYQPITNTKLSDNIKETTKALNGLQKKLIWIHIFQQIENQLPAHLKLSFGEAGGFGRNYAVFLFSKNEWKRDYFDGKTLSANSMNIHFELSIDLIHYNKVIDLALHYEPNPYKPKKQYESVKGYLDYEALRAKRRDQFHQAIKQMNQADRFIPRTAGSNSILRIQVKDHKTFESLTHELIEIMGLLTPLIDEAIKVNESFL